MRTSASPRVRAFLGMGGVASFHRFERIAAAAGAGSATDRSAAAQASVMADLRASGRRAWSDAEWIAFCHVVSASAEETLGLRPFAGQLVTAMALAAGHGVHLATGEGKTLAGAIAANAYALHGRRVHMVSVNDYLARRDSEWMAPLYAAFGVSTGWVSAESGTHARRRAHDSDVLHVSASELGFDALRDRFRADPTRGPLVRPDVAIVDEVDAVLIDEATTPLVLATASRAPGRGYDAASRELAAIAVAGLHEDVHFEIDTDRRNVSLTEAGIAAIEHRMGIANLFDARTHDHLTTVNLALHARALMHRDVDYLVRDDRVELVSPDRGRVASAQRWPDGLQEAIEVKEGIAVSATSEVLDSLTIRDLMTLHRTVCGMSGTAAEVAPLLSEGYGFTTGTVASRLPSRRVDHPDRVFRNAADRDEALLAHVRDEHATGRPVLIGTTSVAASERLQESLYEQGVDAVVLNAKNDADEASVIARAGEFGRVTISTQMAGRGTDIRLGGADERDRERIVALGGLSVIGTERYHTRRLDQQLRGRAGRQGDPGSSIFFVSLDDDVVTRNLDLLSEEHAERPRRDAAPTGSLAPGEHSRAGRLIDHAQRVGEASLEQLRASTVRYAEIPSRQRSAVLRMRDAVVDAGLRGRRAEDSGARTLLTEVALEALGDLDARFGRGSTERFATCAALFHLDETWCGHAAVLAEAREGIHLRSLARDDPLAQYTIIAQREFEAFVPSVAAALETDLVAAAGADRLNDDVSGFLRPGSTWTYMVTEDPFGSPEKRLWRRASAPLRRLLR
ncbi:accessory Sec system translocase SecA2 [Herbiconiux sp. KACC 21604]|uniref:accessory Sec system translocase SecA2 n=1 Tax=unclassified Herbiconiux TaxID=2618217 RepID=UPI001491531D|nr:accessory Sec system translocase SecA2 [Herbiconiux sp. SALV-R1]QJU53685.1 accessory Sec system translocase SecA2 [Herbiconiux sp. SALV-R1]WPO84688.1 accessory Sec system translocase SecA2 [Herbiconiux sp. KACC 21604]